MGFIKDMHSPRRSRVLRMSMEADEEKYDELLMLLRRRDLGQFESLLQTGRTVLEQRNLCFAKACELPNAVEFVRALLTAGVDVNSFEPHPAEVACHRFDLPLLKLLLQHPSLDVNVRFADTRTILMWLCFIECKHSETLLLTECFDLILDNDQLEVNVPDSNGMAAIMYAVENDYEGRVLVLLKQKKHILNLDILLPFAGQSIRNCILSKFPDFRLLIPPPLMEDINSLNIQKKFLAALQATDIDLFASLCSKVDVNYFYGNPYYFTCLEFACQSRKYSQFVKVLLENGADPVNCKRAHLVPFIHYIVASCSIESLDLFIGDERVNIWETDALMHTPFQVSANRRYTDEEDHIGLVECTERLLILAEEQEQPHLVNNQDVWGDTALHDSSLYGGDQITLLLLRHGASVSIENEEKQTALSNITPSVLEAYLDERIRCNDLSALSERYTITFDYDFLRPHGGFDGPCELTPLEHMTSPNLQHLLDHPVINSFLDLKWQNIRCFYILDVILYLVFVLSLSVYILLITFDRYGYTNPYPFNGTILKSTNDSKQPQWFVKHSDYQCLSGDKSILLTVIICRSLYGITLQLLILRELIQFLIQRGLYLRYWRNYLDILIIVISFPPWLRPCMRYPLDAHLNAISILLAWTEFILLLGHMPLFCIQLNMLTGVTSTFIRFMTWYSLMLFPFAISFLILFGRNMDNYANPHRCVIRTIGMFAGELDTNSMMFDYVPVTSEFIFFLFVFLIAIILQNLIGGLAVSDTQLIKANAKVLSHVELVRLVSRMERSLHTIRKWKPFRPFAQNVVIPRIRLFMGVLKQRSKARVLPNKNGRVLFYSEDATDSRRVYYFSSSITTEATNILIRTHKERRGHGQRRRR